MRVWKQPRWHHLLFLVFAFSGEPLGAIDLEPGASEVWNGEFEFLDPVPASRLEKGPVLTPGFCSQWNPDFNRNGGQCCSRERRSRKGARHVALGRGWSYCSEMTEEQLNYTQLAEQGELGDVLALISAESESKGPQAFCSVNDGFLAWGRRLIPSEANRILLRSPGRCTEFGTDPMIGMLEWLGREVATRYQDPEWAGVRLVVGDISAPRGGVLRGRKGKRGHRSHTNGQDADLGFLKVQSGIDSPPNFLRTFDLEANGWLIRRIFENPIACVKVIFLDAKHIRKLDKEFQGDEGWGMIRRFVKHAPGHANHFHIRIGDAPGAPGCAVVPSPETDEINSDTESGDELFELAPEVSIGSGSSEQVL